MSYITVALYIVDLSFVSVMTCGETQAMLGDNIIEIGFQP